MLTGGARGRHLVADAPDRDDRRRIAELAPQLADVDVDRAGVDPGVGVAPHALEELVAREHEPAMVEQLPQEVELLRRELHLGLPHAHLAPAGVDEQVAVADLLRLGPRALRRRAAEDRLHAGHQLARVERLREVVVGADLEPDDLVDVLVARGQHQDRDVGALADPAADLHAVDVREHEVEHDERRLARLGLGERGRAVGGRPHRVAGVLEVERDEGGDRGLVLDHEHGL